MARRRTTNPDAMFISIREAAERSGLSMKYIRQGCHDNRIPFIRVGGDFRINWPRWADALDEESKGV